MRQNEKILPDFYSSQQKKSPDAINQQIERQIEANVGFFKKQDEQSIKQRIAKLDHTLDIEKAVKMNMVSLALVTGVLSITVDKKWTVLSAAAAIFFIQQELFGSSLPFKAFRRMGLRTAIENDLEKNAVKQLLAKPD